MAGIAAYCNRVAIRLGQSSVLSRMAISTSHTRASALVMCKGRGGGLQLQEERAEACLMQGGNGVL